MSGCALYTYVGNDPLNKTDPSGNIAFFDDVIGAVGGALVGIAVEVGKDLWTGEPITGGGVLGAAVGGALMGEGIVNAPETLGGSVVAAGAARGAVVGAISNGVQQGTDIATGKQEKFSGTSLVVSTAIGAATGGIAAKVPVTTAPGISSGAGNMRAAAQSARTRVANGNASNTTLRTQVQGAIGGQVGDAGRTVAGATVDTAKTVVCQNQFNGCK